VRAKHFVAIVAFGGFSFSATAPAVAAEKDEVTPPSAQRPAILPGLYVSLAAMQAWDIYSTRAALQAGAREANPLSRASTRHTASLVGLKAVTTASSIFFAERMWKKSRVGAVVMLVAINGATAAVSMHNMRNAKMLSRR
jgi:hypothetical protein